MHLPHDTYFCAKDNSISVQIRHKPACLLFNDKKWRIMRLGAPLDRERTLNKDELKTIAEWARRIATETNQPIKLMILGRISGARGSKALLPFHFTIGEVVPPTFGIDRPQSGVLTIRSVDDFALAAASSTIRDIAIEPAIELMRDSRFLVQLAELAVEKEVPIFFEGSLLAHAYHIVTAAGAVVGLGAAAGAVVGAAAGEAGPHAANRPMPAAIVASFKTRRRVGICSSYLS